MDGYIMYMREVCMFPIQEGCLLSCPMVVVWDNSLVVKPSVGQKCQLTEL